MWDLHLQPQDQESHTLYHRSQLGTPNLIHKAEEKAYRLLEMLNVDETSGGQQGTASRIQL